MSDSGFSGLPPGTPRTGENAYPQSMAERKAEIIALRGDMKVTRVRQKMEGEIIRRDADGTAHIRTDKGEITVSFRGKNPPPEGTKVEIEIPPARPDGAPPRQVVIRPLPATSPPQASLPPDIPTAAPAPPVTQHLPSSPAPPRPFLDVAIPVETPPLLTAPIPRSAEQQPLRPGDLLRLIPVPPDDIAASLAARIIEVSAQPPALQPAFFLPPLPDQVAAPVLLQTPLQSIQKQDSGNALPLLPASAFPENKTAILPVKFSSPALLPERNILPLPPWGNFIPAAAFTFSQTPAALENLILAHPLQPVSSPFQPGKIFTARVEALAPPAAFFTEAHTAPAQTQEFFAAAIKKEQPPTQIQITALSKKPDIPGQPFIALPPNHAGSITGTITGITTRNMPVLSFFPPGLETAQNFALPFLPADFLPAGTQVRIIPQSPPSAAASAALPFTPAFIPALFFSDFSWPAMNDLYQALQQAAPQTAQAFANTVMNAAATPAKIPAAALFFLAAIRSGDLGSWLGDKAVDTLRRAGKGELISRLARDFSGLQRASAEPSGSGGGAQDWRTTAFPMIGDDGLYKMMLHYRHEQGKNEDGQEERRGTRFLFDLTLSHMGAVQLDGLYRTVQNRQNRLDLIVRTANPLSAPMRGTMVRAYTDALSQTGLSGDLSFQNRPEQFVKIKMTEKNNVFSA